jgi:hypothetical protein
LKYHDFHDTLFRSIFHAFYSAMPIAVYVLFAPFSVNFFAFSIFSYVSGRICIDIQV